jgi:hypothetical protein
MKPLNTLEALKCALTSIPLLQPPNYNKYFLLYLAVAESTIVTHDFGHLDDVLTIVYSGSQQELSPEKTGIYLLPENIFSK